jgi:4-amino-4-deoxy-L-arabinose transferase-like glycosyltransferase
VQDFARADRLSGTPLPDLRTMLRAYPLSAVFVLALIVRLINIGLLEGDNAFFAEADAPVYWAAGAALAKGDGFWPTLANMTDRMPLYPLLLAAVRSIFGDAPRAVALIQAAIDAGTCTLIAALGALVSPLTGLIAGIMAALSATLIVMSSQILTDTLFLFFFATMLLAGAYFLLRPGPWLAAIAGLAGGLALLTRSAIALLLIAAVPLIFVVASLRWRSMTRAIVTAIVFAIAAAAPVTPVLLRNAIQYSSLSLTTQSGDHLAFWIVPLVAQRASGTPYETSVARMEASYRQRLAERGLNDESNPFVRASVKIEIAREEMARLPAAAFVKSWIEGMAMNLVAPALLADPRVRALPKPSFYNTPGTTLWERARVYFFDHPGLYQALLAIGLATMLPFLLLEAIGFVLLARALPWAAAFAGGVLGYFLLLSGPVASPKYRLPMEPVLIVLAAIPLASLGERHRHTRAKRGCAT